MKGGGKPACTHHNEAHLAHGLLVVIVHLADQGVAQVHGDALDRLVLPSGVEDAEQELVDPAVLELQLLGDAEVAEGQAAVPLDLGRAETRGAQSGADSQAELGGSPLEVRDPPELWWSRKAFWKRRRQGFLKTRLTIVKHNIHREACIQ